MDDATSCITTSSPSRSVATQSTSSTATSALTLSACSTSTSTATSSESLISILRRESAKVSLSAADHRLAARMLASIKSRSSASSASTSASSSATSLLSTSALSFQKKFCDIITNIQEIFCNIEEMPNKQDVYLRRAIEQGWKTLSSFKLLEIDERFNILDGVKRAMDIYPNSGWSKVLSRKLHKGEKFQINYSYYLFYNELKLQEELALKKESGHNKENPDVKIFVLDPSLIPNYSEGHEIAGHITYYFTSHRVFDMFKSTKVDLVMCTNILNITGVQSFDALSQASFVVNVLFNVCYTLRPGGTLIVAILKETDNDLLKLQLSVLFKEVDIFRPKSSKFPQTETFAICRQFSPPEGFDPEFMKPYLDRSNKDFSPLTGINRIIIPFLIYGDLSAYPLSPDDEEQLFKDFSDKKCSVPFPVDQPCSSKSSSRKDDVDYHLETSTGTEADSSPNIRKWVGRPLFEDGGVGQDMDNGPLFDLIQKTTRLRTYPSRINEPLPLPDESELQFLYEDETTDPEEIRECLERVRMGMKSSTCTCEDFS